MKVAKPNAVTAPRRISFVLLLAVILAALFWKSFLPGYVHFSNDGPLGQQNAEWSKAPTAFSGCWDDLNDIGSSSGSLTPSFGILLRWAFSPAGFAKFFAPMALFILGLGAWTFFRQLKLSPLAAALGGLAAALDSAYFSNACWGVASQQIAVGMTYFALALVVSNAPETPPLTRWVRLVLAGLAVGVNVMEGADNGAIYSLFIAAFVLVKALLEEGRPVWLKLGSAITRIAVIAVFAAFIAAQSIVSLVGTAIVGVAGTEQTPEAKARQWNFATQWSEPKIETLGLFVPGLFGYRMDTPKSMMSSFQDAYKGGVYWGAVGRDAAWDRYFAGDRKGPAPDTNYRYLRFSGGGGYQGILVALIAIWAIAQSFRRRDSVFSESQRRFIWFWMGVMVLAILLAWGRFAPFYQFFYALPYSSTIRNPTKFISVFSWAFLVVFAHGIHGLCRRYLEVPAAAAKSSVAQLQSWWKNVRGFDRRWTLACASAVAGSILAWLIYASQKTNLVGYLQDVGFPDKSYAGQIAGFSIGQAGWFILFFALAVGLCTLVIAGIFSGKRAKLGGILLGALLVADLGRANLPWIIHWNYVQKYDVDPDHPGRSTNPIINLLRDKPYEHRVAMLPFSAAPHLPNYDDYFAEVYRIEWAQHHFPYYNIQSLDVVQRPRIAEDMAAYNEALQFRGTQDSLHLIARHWELTDTRYLLGPAGFLGTLNQELDPAQQRFRIVQPFDIVPKPGIEQLTGLEEMTAALNDNGGLALFEFTGALPRAKLYSHWELAMNDPAAVAGLNTNQLDTSDWTVLQHLGTNDFLTLKKLTSPEFDPWQTVLLAESPAAPGPASATNGNSGTVEFTSYQPEDIKLHTQADTATVLLLNDKHDPHWRVFVDGKPAPLLRCNYIMRGVYLPTGGHTVEFQFRLPVKPLYVTLAAIAVAIVLSGVLIFLTRKPQTPEKK